MAVETVVGQNLGTGRRKRARRTVYIAIAILGGTFLIAGTLTIWFARPIIGLFITGPGADAIISHGARFLRIVAPTWIIMVSYHMMNGAFYGSGSTRMALGIGVTTLWGVRAVVAILAVIVFSLDAIGAWYAIALSNTTAAIAGGIFFFRGRWLENVLEDDPTEETDPDTDPRSTD